MSEIATQALTAIDLRLIEQSLINFISQLDEQIDACTVKNFNSDIHEHYVNKKHQAYQLTEKIQTLKLLIK